MLITIGLFLAGSAAFSYIGVTVFESYNKLKAPVYPTQNMIDDGFSVFDKMVESADKYEREHHDELTFWLHPNRWDGIEEHNLRSKNGVPFWSIDRATLPKPVTKKKNTIAYTTPRHLQTRLLPCGCSYKTMITKRKDRIRCEICTFTWTPASNNLRQQASDVSCYNDLIKFRDLNLSYRSIANMEYIINA